MSKLRLGYSGSSLLSPVFLAFILTLVTPVAVAQSNSVFNGPRDYPVGASPNSVVIGDFNGDGRPDIATANDTSNDVSVLLQNNDGTFQTAVSYPAGSAPILLQAGDVNGDGKLDLLFINLLWPNDTLAVLLSNGDGTFQAPQFTAFPYGSLPYMVLGDFNGDGKTDVAFAEPTPQIDIYDIGVLLSNGNGTFQTPVAYPVSGTLVGWGAADVNKDGKLDIVSVGSFSGNGGVSVLLGKGDGTFQAAITSATPGATSRRVVIADFNQDGNLDVVGTAHGVRTYFSVYWGNGDGTFRLEPLSQPELPFLCDSEAFDLPVAVGDVNGDGKPDLFVDCEIFAQDGNPQPWNPEGISFLSRGDGTFIEGPAVIMSAAAVSMADLNGDDKLDLIAAEFGGVVSVLHGNGDGNFAQFPSYYALTTRGVLETVVAEDFNGDGKPDLVGAFVPFDAYSMDLGLLLNSGVGFLPPTETVAPRDQAFGSFYVAAGDFNGDGKMDIAEVFDELSILLGKGDGTFQPAVQYRAGMSGPIAVGDFNNDGKLDIVGGSSTGLSLLLGNGDGTFGFPVNSPGGSPGAVADFNRDGKLDVATLGGQILFGNGDGTFSAGPTYNAGFAIASGDLNGDSIPDIVVATLYGVDTASSVLILLGNGDGTFQSPTATKVGNGINSIAIGDFNLDGKADVVVSNTGWSDVSLLLGNGDGTLQPPVEFAVGGDFNPGGLAVSDFDGNGSLDLAVASTANIFVLLNTAGSHTHAALLSADALAFEAEKGQTTSPQAVTLSYMASSALTIKGITISGPQSGDFEQTNNCGTSLAAIGNCTISVTFTPQTVGARAAAIQITNNAFNSPQVIRLSGTGTAPPSIGFTVPSGGSNFATVTAGQPANYTLSIGGAGMTGSATFTCNGAPRGATCVVPSSVGVSDTSTSTVYVAVSTTSRTMASVNSRGMIRFGGVWAAFLLGLVLVPAARRKRPSSGLYLGALVASLLLIASCGGSSSGPNTNPNGTPAGTYKLTVTATLNSTTEDVTLQLIVQ